MVRRGIDVSCCCQWLRSGVLLQWPSRNLLVIEREEPFEVVCRCQHLRRWFVQRRGQRGRPAEVPLHFCRKPCCGEDHDDGACRAGGSIRKDRDVGVGPTAAARRTTAHRVRAAPVLHTGERATAGRPSCGARRGSTSPDSCRALPRNVERGALWQRTRRATEVHRRARADGEPVFARFDPPFMPSFLLRIGIQIPVQAPAAR
jgi:hypothetical protein